MFELYTLLIAAVVALSVYWGVVHANDTLHPLVYLMPMAGFFYVFMAVELYLGGGLLQHFSWEEVTYVQGLNLVSIAALAAGCYRGSQLKRDPSRIDLFSFDASPFARRTLFRIGVGFGILALAAYLYQVANVGGFYAAYDDPKGGGWAASGYIRDFDLLAAPAIVLIYLGRSDRKLLFGHRVLVAAFSFPLLVHGLLSARRGPTFLALATLVGGWYLARRRRPSVPQVAIGGAVFGLLLLALVTFRGEIYLGSSFLMGDTPAATEIVEESLERSTQSTFANEYMYGTYVVLNARDRAGHYWGTRYLTQILVRPIPSSLWPNKYEDVGMEEIKVNAGQLGTTNREAHPMIPKGSAPGVVGGAYVEWAWGAPLFLFLIGWLYGFSWCQHLTLGGVWTVLYTIFLSLSAYFIAQSFLAVLYKLLLLGLPTFFFWYAFRPTKRVPVRAHSVSA